MNLYRGGKPRAVYERYKDTENEKRVQRRLQQAWNCSLEKTRMFHFCDWVARRDGKLKAIVEFKCRTNQRLKYDTYMISLRKWNALEEESKRLDVPAILLVEWTDFLGYVRVGEVETTIGFGGRSDRNDPQDMERVVYINTELFKGVGQ